MKQRRDEEQFRVEFQMLADALHRSEQEDTNRVVEQHLGFVLPHQSAASRAILLSGILTPEIICVSLHIAICRPAPGWKTTWRWGCRSPRR
jgi:hypothetical protein